MQRVEWLLDSEPREVQLEALRRSFYGYRFKEHKDDPGVFRPFRDGYQHGWNHYLEMRLGKTPVSLNEFELYHRDHGIKRMFSFCPNTYKQGWVDEAAKQGASVPWAAWESGNLKAAEKFAAETKGEFGMSINYEALKSEDLQGFLAKYLNHEAFQANDESIKIKDHNSFQTKATLGHCNNAGVIRNLSGLPFTQGPHDLYPQFRAVRRLNGLNYFAYRNKYCKMGGFKGKKVIGAKDPDEIDQLLNTCSFVAKIKHWGNPKVPNYYMEKLQMSPAQKYHYDAMDRDMVTILASGEEITADMVITKMMKLQQISSGFLYVQGKLAEYLEDPTKTAKMARLLTMMEEIPGKVIIVYNYQETGNALLKCLDKWNPAVIRGKQWMKANGRDTDAEKKRFNLDPACRPMILQTQSGKYGHDLTATEQDRCATMVFYENTYSLDDRSQIEARNTTAFQDWTSNYFDFVCSPVEANAVKALARKESVVDSVVGSYRYKPGELII